MDIPEAYGVLLSRGWSSKLQGYFSKDWSHFWLPYKGRNNHIQVKSESYMEYIMTPLDGHNEPISFSDLIFGNYFLETDNECYQEQSSPIPSDT